MAAETHQHLCRLCLQKTYSQFFSLLENEASSMLLSLTSIKVDLQDPFSTMCEQCRTNLKTAYDIQQYIIKSDEKLRNGSISEMVKDELPDYENNCMLPLEVLLKETVDSKKDIKKSDSTSSDNDREESNEDKPKRQKRNLKPPQTVTCEICFKIFPSRLKYNRHKSMHRDNNKRAQKTECPICHKKVVFCYLKRHVDFHNGNGFVCEFCGSSFCTASYLRSHINTKHKGMVFKCEECDKTFKRKLHRDSHYRREHTGQPVDICSICGKKFYKSGYLKQHTNIVHLNLKLSTCSYCGKEFKQAKTLKTHLRLHTNERPYKCDVCGQGFVQNVLLKGHKKSKHNIVESEDVKCGLCGKGFATEQAVRSHMRVHT